MWQGIDEKSLTSHLGRAHIKLSDPPPQMPSCSADFSDCKTFNVTLETLYFPHCKKRRIFFIYENV